MIDAIVQTTIVLVSVFLGSWLTYRARTGNSPVPTKTPELPAMPQDEDAPIKRRTRL